MRLELENEENYKIDEIVTIGSFHSAGYRVWTIVFRLNRSAVSDFVINDSAPDRLAYSTVEEYKEACEWHQENMEEWNRRVRSLLKWDEDSGCITQSCSEVFTAVFMKKEEARPDDLI